MAWKSRRGNGSQKFKTDEDISAAEGGSQKPLQRWVDDSTTNDGLANLTLETSSSNAPWDQFAANKEKFGIVPTYDELQYTTEVDTSHPDFAEREKQAAKLAKEIEGDSGNKKQQQQNLDEEDLYSGVVRNKQQQFAAKEAQRAQISPSYLQQRERHDESEDLKKFAQDFKVKGEVPEDLLPALGKKPRKKKFDFKASVAKGSSFSPPPHSKSASPAQSMPPMMSPAIPPPHMVPPMMPMIPMMPPVYGGMHPPQQGPGPVPPQQQQQQQQPAKPDTKVVPAKPLGDAFDYIHHLKSTNSDIPPIFATLPTYATTSTLSYVDQLPTVSFAPQIVPWM